MKLAILPVVAAVVLTAMPGIAQLPASAATGPGQLSGRLLRDGAPALGRVRVQIWPAQDQLHALPDGTRFDLLTVGTVDVTADGSFALPLPAVLGSRYIGKDGVINVEVVGSDGTVAAVSNLSVMRVAPNTGTRLAATTAVTAGDHVRYVDAGKLGPASAAASAGSPIKLDLGSNSANAARALSLSSAQAHTDAAATPVLASASSVGMATTAAAADVRALAAPITQCYNQTGARHGPYYESFATYYGTAYAKGRIDHNTGTTHTLGIAYHPQGGKWGSAGVQTVTSTTVGYDSDYTIADATVQNRVWQRYYYTKCTYAGVLVETNTSSRPDGFADGPYYTRAAHTDFTTCSTTYANHTYSRVSNKNTTFTAGLDLPWVNVSAQSGWSSGTAMYWKYTKAGKLCGSNGQLWGTAPQVSAKA